MSRQIRARLGITRAREPRPKRINRAARPSDIHRIAPSPLVETDDTRAAVARANPSLNNNRVARETRARYTRDERTRNRLDDDLFVPPKVSRHEETKTSRNGAFVRRIKSERCKTNGKMNTQRKIESRSARNSSYVLGILIPIIRPSVPSRGRGTLETKNCLLPGTPSMTVLSARLVIRRSINPGEWRLPRVSPTSLDPSPALFSRIHPPSRSSIRLAPVSRLPSRLARGRRGAKSRVRLRDGGQALRYCDTATSFFSAAATASATK